MNFPTWKLAGFVLPVVLYYTVLNAVDNWPAQSTTTVIFKLLPLVYLISIIMLVSMEDGNKVKPTSYRVSISLGLVASAVGDSYLTFANTLPGLCSFGVAQLCYTKAFGIRKFGNGLCAAIFAAISVADYFWLFDAIPMSIVKVAFVVYWSLLVTACWRATIQMLLTRSRDNVAASVGAIMFLLSDTLFVLNQVHSFQFSRGPFWIMLTYYLAQLGIALSACGTTSAKKLK